MLCPNKLKLVRYNSDMLDNSEFNTPMMQQYNLIKQAYPDAILFFRLGDFYEMFLEDAKIGAKVLGITLTSRDKGKDGKIPMAGVPYHAAENYILKLVNNGYKVAICEQVTEPQKGKELVEREVIRVITPSTILSESSDSNITNDYLLVFSQRKRSFGFALVSVKSGEVLVGWLTYPQEINDPTLIVPIIRETIARYQPAEVLLPPVIYDSPNIVREIFNQGVSPFRFQALIENFSDAKDLILSQYQLSTLESIGLDSKHESAIALANAIAYLKETQKNEIEFLKIPRIITPDGYLSLTGQTIRNLELFGNLRQSHEDYSLYAVLNNTSTAMGNRLLKNWLLSPLAVKEMINDRYDVVSYFIQQPEISDRIREYLEVISDLERMASRLAIKIGNGRDLIAVKNGLFAANNFRQLLNENPPQLLNNVMETINWDQVEALISLIDQAIEDNPPITITEGAVIKSAYDQKLDELREIAKGGKAYLAELEQQEQQRTGISSLKIGFNTVFGYYIEVSKANSDKVPSDYIRRQTLTNGERYIIPELKEHEGKVLSAQSEANDLEYELFKEVSAKVMTSIRLIQQVAELIAQVDVLLGFAQNATASNYHRPEITDDRCLLITNGRHPVVEQVLTSSFVPNNTNLTDDTRMMIITGANMAGKSTYIRQVALLIIMAQVGSFVPADKMAFTLFNEIHTRIGAMDSLVSGLSTFMVEMVETAAILNNVTDNSLVILDEIGRGTSTYDGLAIAWAISEHLLQNTKAKVFFATHYHELTDLTSNYHEAVNYHLAIAKEENEVIFLYQIKPGKADQSFGIEVAKRAGLPKSVVSRANNILIDLNRQSQAISPISAKQMDLFTN